MSIDGRTPKVCFDAFREHTANVIASVLGVQFHVGIINRRDEECHAKLHLGVAGVDYVVLKSPSHGEVYFSLDQNLEAVKIDRKHYELRTRAYWYKVYATKPDDESEPLFRWEYGPVDRGKDHCEHHFQIGKVIAGRAIEVPLGASTLDLNRVHLPTGYVLFEYVLRFLISELRVPPATSGWAQELIDSERKFFCEFVPAAG